MIRIDILLSCTYLDNYVAPLQSRMHCLHIFFLHNTITITTNFACCNLDQYPTPFIINIGTALMLPKLGTDTPASSLWDITLVYLDRGGVSCPKLLRPKGGNPPLLPLPLVLRHGCGELGGWSSNYQSVVL